MARTTFISDLHLGPRPGPAQGHFLALCSELAERGRAGREQRLVVAGDLFSFWVERPALVRRLHGRVLEALAGLVRGGCPVWILEGNRDFGLGRALREATGAGTPGERLVLEAGGRKVLVLHGDQLLTADRRYQLFKRLIRSWPSRLVARILPRFLLLWGVRRLERVSQLEKSNKPAEAMQIDESAAARELETAGAEVLVAGHLHVDSRRELDVGGRGGRKCPLFVLGAWRAGGAKILDWPDDGEPKLIDWPPRGAED